MKHNRLMPLAILADVDYSRDIQPVLSDNCYRCHGPDAKKRKAGLRLDVEEVAKATEMASLNQQMLEHRHKTIIEQERRLMQQQAEQYRKQVEQNAYMTATQGVQHWEQKVAKAEAEKQQLETQHLSIM